MSECSDFYRRTEYQGSAQEREPDRTLLVAALHATWAAGCAAGLFRQTRICWSLCTQCRRVRSHSSAWLQALRVWPPRATFVVERSKLSATRAVGNITLRCHQRAGTDDPGFTGVHPLRAVLGNAHVAVGLARRSSRATARLVVASMWQCRALCEGRTMAQPDSR